VKYLYVKRANAEFSSTERPRTLNRTFRKFLFFTILLLGQALMASTVEFIEVNGVKVPFIYEQDSRLPLVSMQVVFTGSGSIDEGDQHGLARRQWQY